jgi:hypothetical protein
MRDPGSPLNDSNLHHQYGAYLVFQFLAREYGHDVVRTAWDNAAQYGSLEAVQRAIPGGFEEAWPEFAACLWNEPPVDCFAAWDDLYEHPGTWVLPREVTLDGDPTASFSVTGNVEHTAISYSQFVFNDPDVRSVTFDNTLAGLPHAAVQALVKVGGQWQGPLDWTDEAKPAYCRDNPAQNIEELVIIVSNNDWETKGTLSPAKQPALIAGNACGASVELSWTFDTGVDIAVFPGPAADMSEVFAQQSLPGYAANTGTECTSTFYPDPDVQPDRSTAIDAVMSDSHYIAIWYYDVCHYYGWDEDQYIVPFTLTIRYPDGSEDELTGQMVGFDDFRIFGPFNFGPPSP